jgi:hypothetical protein
MDPIQVRIRNFQSIQEASFVIHGMTCIVGKTNIGKSATLRSIASAILNQPVTNMIRHGEKVCTVELHSKDWGFKWEKGAGTNRYRIDGKEEILDSVGRGQIEEIRDFGFGTIKIGENNYLSPWYANQFEPIFLLNQSGPAITDFISEVSRLDVLQDGIVFLNKEKKRFKEKIKIISSDIENLTEKKRSLEKLPKMREVKQDLRLQYESILVYENRIRDCQKVQSQIESLNNEIEILESIQRVRMPIAMDTKSLDKIRQMQNLQNQLDQGAKSILKVRGIEKVSMPAAMETPDFRRLEEIDSKSSSSRFLGIYHFRICPSRSFPSISKKAWIF